MTDLQAYAQALHRLATARRQHERMQRERDPEGVAHWWRELEQATARCQEAREQAERQGKRRGHDRPARPAPPAGGVP